MASPQVENGYTKIANELLEEIYTLDINIGAMKVLLFILRKTYGWGKKRDKISLSQFKKALKKEQPHICRDIKKLITMKILIKIQNDDGSEYEINKNYDEWEVVPKQAHARIGNDSLPELVITPVPKQAHTKETITKETKQKKELLALKESLPNTEIGSAPKNPPPAPLLVKAHRKQLAIKLGKHKTDSKSKLYYRLGYHFLEHYPKWHGTYPLSYLNILPIVPKMRELIDAGETETTLQDLQLKYLQSKKAKELACSITTCYSDDTVLLWKQGKLGTKENNNSQIDDLMKKI